MTALRCFSSGGGIQSTAALVEAAEGRIDFPTFVFCHVGEDSERPATLTYLRDYARPFAEEHGIRFVELRRQKRDGSPAPSLLQEIMRPDTKSVPIPVRMSNGAPGVRACTGDYKIKVVARWCREQGATADEPAVVAIGFSWDEVDRMTDEPSGFAHVTKAYPLLERRLTRRDCSAIIVGAGLPLPPKSACWFCPMQKAARWGEMRQAQPARFRQAVALERHVNETRTRIGRDPAYLTRFGRPLDEAIADQPALFADEHEGCDDGWCFR